MPKVPPEWFLTSDELARKAEIEKEARVLNARHAELVRQMQMPGGLNDEERLEVREVSQKFTKLFEERQALLKKNPMLPENLLKDFDRDS